MTTLERVAGAVIGVAGLSGLVICANASITVHGSGQAILRLAFSVRPERIERCRQQSDEELERLPAHMRQPIICEGTSAEYRLTVLHDGVVAAERLVHGGGLRHDRRIYVFQELPLAPGEGTIEVRFDRIDADTSHVAEPETDHDGRKSERDPDDREAEQRDRQSGETVPAHLMLTQRLQIRSREVILVTYAQERRALAAIRAPVTN